VNARLPPNLAPPDLWSLALGGQPIDISSLIAALNLAVAGRVQFDLDFRTRLLIRDVLHALAQKGNQDRLAEWIRKSANPELLAEIWSEPLGEIGFPSLQGRLMETTKPEIVLQFLRELGMRSDQSARIELGGATALILANVLTRRTEDIDVVDEIPAALRSQHELLNELYARYGIRFTHFQSHFLPTGWKDRLHSLGVFGKLSVYRVDVCDIFVGKLFSKRAKDRDDLRALAAHLPLSDVESRLKNFGGKLLSEPPLAANAVENWYILFGSQIPR
jgi:hypothetical protein